MNGPTVQLFVTCLVDALAPEVGSATVEVLEQTGAVVEYQPGQTCCGQPADNVGMADTAQGMAANTLDVLDETEGPIVVPSGSCAAMMSHRYPELFAGSDREDQAKRVASRVVELTHYLYASGSADLVASCGDCKVALHHACHGLRTLGTGPTTQALVDGVTQVRLEDAEECCGFGGLFSVELPAISADILDKKLDRIERSGADVVVAGDISCLLHIEGGLRRRGSKVVVKHVAQLLAGDEHD